MLRAGARVEAETYVLRPVFEERAEPGLLVRQHLVQERNVEVRSPQRCDELSRLLRCERPWRGPTEVIVEQGLGPIGAGVEQEETRQDVEDLDHGSRAKAPDEAAQKLDARVGGQIRGERTLGGTRGDELGEGPSQTSGTSTLRSVSRAQRAPSLV